MGELGHAAAFLEARQLLGLGVRDFGLELLDELVIAIETDLLRELVVERGRFLLADFLDGGRRVDGLSGKVGVELRREVELLLVTRLHADELLGELLRHHGAADLDQAALVREAVDGGTVRGGREPDHHEITLLGGAIDRLEIVVVILQRVELDVHVLLRRLFGGHLDFDRLVGIELDVRLDVTIQREGVVLAIGHEGIVVGGGLANEDDVLPVNGQRGHVVDQIRGDLRVDGIMTAKVLLDDLTRRLARAKARDTRLRELLECLVDVLLDLVCGHGDSDLGLAVFPGARGDFQRSSKIPRLQKALTIAPWRFGLWCGRKDSNLHGSPHWNLNPARLPVPPRPRTSCA